MASNDTVGSSSTSASGSEEDWVWIVEVRLDGKWVLRNGPLATYEHARWHVSDSLRESNNWRIRGGVGLGARGKDGKT